MARRPSKKKIKAAAPAKAAKQKPKTPPQRDSIIEVDASWLTFETEGQKLLDGNVLDVLRSKHSKPRISIMPATDAVEPPPRNTIPVEAEWLEEVPGSERAPRREPPPLPSIESMEPAPKRAKPALPPPLPRTKRNSSIPPSRPRASKRPPRAD